LLRYACKKRTGLGLSLQIGYYFSCRWRRGVVSEKYSFGVVGMIGKRGIMWDPMLKGILFIVSFLVLGYWIFSTIIPDAQDATERATCRTSFDINAKRLSVSGVEIVGNVVDVNCPIISKKITGDTKEQVFGQLADLMVFAWDDFRRGKKKLFEDESAVFCLPRYAPITFAEEDKIYPGFNRYLLDESPIGIDETYAAFLMNRPLREEERTQLLASKDVINSNVEYAVIFTMAKDSSMDQFVNIAIGAALIGVTFATAGFTTPLAIAFFVSVGAAGGVGYNAITGQDYGAMLDLGITSAYVMGGSTGDGYLARLWLLPYADLGKLDCEEYKLKRLPPKKVTV